MNKTVTSKEILLQQAKQIVLEYGIEKLSIRLLAQKCGIAVGSVYNYFPAKADLIFALVEDFWKIVFRPEEFEISEIHSFVAFVEQLYQSFAEHLIKFRMVYAGQLTILNSKDKIQGKVIEQKYLSMVHKCIADALERDDNIKSSIWTDEFTKELFSKFIFDNMCFMLIRGQKDCNYLKDIIIKIIY